MYQDIHEDEFTVMEVDENEIENGMAQLFKNGVIQLSWRMVKGKRDGKLTIYKNGVVDRMTTWESFEKDVSCEVVNDECGKRLLVEMNKLSGVMLYKGEYDHATLKKSGWGIEYDESGFEKYFGYDKLIHIKQAFMRAEEGEEGEEGGKMMMIEYAGDVKEDNVKNVLNRRPVYMGGYSFKKMQNEFIRAGIGYEINELSGICDRISEWDENGEKKTKDDRDRALFGGWYSKGESDQSIRMSEIDDQEKKRRRRRERERREREEKEREEREKREREEKERKERQRREKRERERKEREERERREKERREKEKREREERKRGEGEKRKTNTLLE